MVALQKIDREKIGWDSDPSVIGHLSPFEIHAAQYASLLRPTNYDLRALRLSRVIETLLGLGVIPINEAEQ